MEMKMYSIIVFLFALFNYSTSTELSVPFVAWGVNSDIKAAPPTSFGHTLKLEKIYKEHIQPLAHSKAPLLIFLQDELSKDDFVKYRKSFQHLQKVFVDVQTIYFPSVSQGKKIEALVQESGAKVEYVSSSELSDWTYSPPKEGNGGKVILFNLEPLTGSDYNGKADILKRNDLLMHRIIKTLKEQITNFYVIFTSEEPSRTVVDWLFDEKISHVGSIGRHLLADKPSSKTPASYFVVANNLTRLYLSTISLTTELNKTEITMNVSTIFDVTGTNESVTLTMKKDVTVQLYSDVVVEIILGRNIAEWFAKKITLTGKYNETISLGLIEFTHVGGNATDVYHGSTPISAPIGMSFSCGQGKMTSPNGTLVFNDLQLEPQGFYAKGAHHPKGFGPAYDCVGFFTIGILTSIFVTVILAVGLYVGLMMIMAIQVQDRLDDPKGKTITTTVMDS